MERRIYNPIQKDYVTFIKTSDDTHGEYTLVKVELADGGGVGIHYHKTYIERFECLEGELEVITGRELHQLREGHSAIAEKSVNHLFRNRSGKTCTFLCELRPASKGFEQSLQIGYGLARDGKSNSKGFPKNPLVLGWLFQISESNLPGCRSIFEFILRFQAKKAIKKGLDKEMIEKYVRF